MCLIKYTLPTYPNQKTVTINVEFSYLIEHMQYSYKLTYLMESLTKYYYLDQISKLNRQSNSRIYIYKVLTLQLYNISLLLATECMR